MALRPVDETRQLHNYFNLLTQLLAPRRTLVLTDDAAVAGAVLAGLRAQPLRWSLMLVSDVPALRQLAVNRRDGESIRCLAAVPRGKANLLLWDERCGSIPERELARVPPRGLLLVYGADRRRGVLRTLLKKHGWRMTYQPWGAGILVGAPPGKGEEHGTE